MTKNNKNLGDADGESLTPEEHLESLLFQYVNLYERWSEDRQVAAKYGSDIAKFVKEFASEIEHFSKIEDAVIAKLKKSLEHTTAHIAEMIHHSVSDSVDRVLAGSATDIKESARHAENLFAEYQSSLNWSHWKIIAITALSSIAASLLIVFFLMPKPIIPLTDAQIRTYRDGLILNSFWDKLSLHQKNWLINLAQGKEDNHEKLIENVKRTYHDINEEQIRD